MGMALHHTARGGWEPVETGSVVSSVTCCCDHSSGNAQDLFWYPISCLPAVLILRCVRMLVMARWHSCPAVSLLRERGGMNWMSECIHNICSAGPSQEGARPPTRRMRTPTSRGPSH
jgi:hypothetical protein